jgi:hypothetical protein
MSGKQGWDIDPVGVRGVLIKTGNVADDIQGEATSFSGNVESAAKSAGTLSMGAGDQPESGLVGAALAEFVEKTKDDITYIAARSGKSIQGTVDATTAYVQGDLTMAADAQRAALKAPDLSPTKEQGGSK